MLVLNCDKHQNALKNFQLKWNPFLNDLAFRIDSEVFTINNLTMLIFTDFFSDYYHQMPSYAEYTFWDQNEQNNFFRIMRFAQNMTLKFEIFFGKILECQLVKSKIGSATKMVSCWILISHWFYNNPSQATNIPKIKFVLKMFDSLYHNCPSHLKWS